MFRLFASNADALSFSFLYIIYLAVDTNFKLKGKDRGLKDIELMPGMGVFVNEVAYQDHLSSYVEQPEVSALRVLFSLLY